MVRPAPQSGNILFLILLAVVLFAALSYAVTSSTRGGGKDASSESVQTKAASITQFFDQIDAAVLRMKLTEGIKNEDLSFGYNTYKQQDGSMYLKYANPNCTVDACKVFTPGSGGVIPRAFDNYAVTSPTGWQTNYTMPGYFEIGMMKFPYAGTDLNDVVITVVGMDPAICDQINSSLGITAPITVGGTGLGANPATWDNTGRLVTGNANLLVGKSTFGNIYGAGSSGAHCSIWHTVLIR